jgi:hypothetical protein
MALGLFFGAGFLCGFLSGYKYASLSAVRELPPAYYETSNETSGGTPADLNIQGAGETETLEEETEMPSAGGIGLVLEDHWMDSDDNGLFIAGMVKNDDTKGFNAIRIAFDLLDENGQVYSAVTGRNDEGVEPGASWDFTIYLPYSEMDIFKSYRLQSVMGVKVGGG